MTKIHDTEVSVIYNDITRTRSTECTKLAGVIGEEYVKMYPQLHDVLGVKSYNKSKYFGIGFTAQQNFILLKFCSSIKEFPITSKDLVIFHFIDGYVIRLMTQIGAKLGSEKVSFIPLSEVQLYQLATIEIDSVEVCNSKLSNSIFATFANAPNYQYDSQLEGAALVKILANHTNAAKALLLSN